MRWPTNSPPTSDSARHQPCSFDRSTTEPPLSGDAHIDDEKYVRLGIVHRTAPAAPGKQPAGYSDRMSRRDEQTPESWSHRTSTGALLWIAQPLCILVELVSISQVRTPYSLIDSTISEAGAVRCTTITYALGQVPVCSPLGWLLNAVTVASGLAVGVGALLLHRSLPTRRIRTGATVAAVLSGLSLIGTGLVPVDLDLNLHVLVALPQFFTFPLMLILLSAAMRSLSRRSAAIAFVAALLCIIGTVAYLVRLAEPQGGGLLERLALWPFWLALLSVGATLLLRKRTMSRIPSNLANDRS